MDKDLAKIEAAFRPVGRLFLSADLVGSTAHKQRASFPITEDGSSWPDDDLSPPWLLPISDFFAQFGRIFKASWDEVCSTATGKKIPCGEPPELWKANGDELIFVKELDDRRELYVCLCAWISAVQNYRKNLQKGGLLDIKSTAWFAGFPITNSEVIFWRDLSDDDKEYQDDSRLNQIHLREIWHKKQKNKNSKLIRDFIGPTIDTGFRLAGFSTIRKMIISLDVAYLAATAMMPPGMRANPIFKWLDIVYDGRFPLKGVMNGIPYPRFWIDIDADNPFYQAEDRIIGKRSYVEREKLIEYCSKFYDEHRNYLLVPFLVKEEDSQYGELPENYKNFLIGRHSRWKSEKERYAAESNSETRVDGEGEDLPKAKIDEIGKSIKRPKPESKRM